MIKLLRNPEVKKTLLIYGLISILSIITAFMLEQRFGFLMLIVCVIFVIVYLIATYKRYKCLAKFTFDINQILHGNQQITIEKNTEGELSLLQNEVHKMVVCLRKQQHQLQDDKLYLVDSIADISHQIRTPLTSINLLLSLVSEPNISTERQQKSFCEIYELLDRIDWLITSLLKISKLDAMTVKFKTEKIPLNELLKKSTAPLLVPIELRNQILKVSAKGDFSSDILWTCEALTNIIKNCMEHTPENGTIEISATENAIYSEIIISDNGSGIAKEDLPHIFERFYKGKDSGNKSFGIGLALARMIITSQNGIIQAKNQKPQGAKFIIRFYKGTV